jgi:HlyD family secretion protein
MDAELKSLRIDRSKKKSSSGSGSWATKWILIGIAIFILAGLGRFVYGIANKATEVETVRAKSISAATAAAEGSVVLNATGYIIAAHKIQLASKVVGKVAWIGVEKGDRVKQGQTLVRLEDDEYKAQVQQGKGNLQNLEAKLAELQNGSRPEEIQRAIADVEQAKADVVNAKVQLDRMKRLVDERVEAKQRLDDAQARYDAAEAKLRSLERTAELVKIGPRKELLDQIRGQIVQAKGTLSFYETQLSNTIITAPVTGTILERNVERGEFVTTGFVGDRGAKGYVVSIADLNDLKVELDINQNDFAKLRNGTRATVTTDAYPDKKYEGVIDEISPEANRQKATVQVKVKIKNPDEFLRPDMNASVAFLADAKPATAETSSAAPSKPMIYLPSTAIRDGAVFLVVDEKAVRRTVKTGASGPQGVRIESGLNGGEDVINNPPAELKDGDKVRTKA